jgi:flavin-dependent dehydrogenase
MAVGTGGYVGLVRVEDGRLNLAAALDPGFVRRQGSLPAAASVVLSEAGLPPIRTLSDASWRGTPALMRQTAFPAGERLFLIGDAAGYIEPFTGEGIAWGIECGMAVAPLAERGCERWEFGLALEWARLHRRTIVRRQRLCRLFASLLRSPRFVGMMMNALSWAPSLSAPFVRALNRPNPTGYLVRQ